MVVRVVHSRVVVRVVLASRGVRRLRGKLGRGVGRARLLFLGGEVAACV